MLDWLMNVFTNWWMVLFGTILFAALPVGVYLLIVRPGFDRKWLTPMIIGIVMALLSIIPFYGMPWLIMLYIGVLVKLVLLIAHAIVWIVAAMQKKEPCIGGAVMTGVTFLLSCVCLGNWPAVVAALCYLVSLFLARYKF